MDAMSKKERLARGSAVIKVMRVIPRPGHFLKTYTEVHKLPRKPKVKVKGMAGEMPHLDVKHALFEFLPNSAKIFVPMVDISGGGDASNDPCGIKVDDGVMDESTLGLPDGDKMIRWFGYREWAAAVNPTYDGHIAEHFNIMLGLLITMAEDPENANFPDTEAYPCVQFLRTIKSPDGNIPYNTSCFISYLEYVCQKILDEA